MITCRGIGIGSIGGKGSESSMKGVENGFERSKQLGEPIKSYNYVLNKGYDQKSIRYAIIYEMDLI